MNVLIDTHVFLWAAQAPERLSGTAHELIADPRNTLLISTASVWEALLKAGKGKLTFAAGVLPAEQLEKELRYQNLLPLAVQLTHVTRASTLPTLHADPFDRLLVAQALVEGVPIVTADEAIRVYPVRTIW